MNVKYEWKEWNEIDWKVVEVQVFKLQKRIFRASRCFDNINHKKLLAKLQTYPSLKRQVKAWLKSGVLDGEIFAQTEQGTPQGGVISPLLANIALHGMEEEVKKYARTMKGCKYKNQISLNLKRWAERRHPEKSRSWVVNKYWQSDYSNGKMRNWVFGTQEGSKVILHSDTPIVRHTKVRGNKSPFDGDMVYWASRLGKHPETTTRMATLLKKQKGKCNYCGLYLTNEDKIEIDHIIPRTCGGKDQYDNLQLLHGHCHDSKTKIDGSLTKK
jgi:5-methylcytosine-specific restriction endonuclease McrA